MTKRYVGFARVSSKEQQEQGFSLDVQERDICAYVRHAGGSLVRMFTVSESASKSEERPVFNEMLKYAADPRSKIDCIVFWRMDRALRNPKDYVRLEDLESATPVRCIFLDEPDEGRDDPDRWFTRYLKAGLAIREIKVSSHRIRKGMDERAEAGWFMGHPPYGYRNKRLSKGKSIVEVDPAKADRVRRIFEVFATNAITIQELGRILIAQGIRYSECNAGFPKNTLHRILRSRAYLGEIEYKGEWRPGQHPPIVSPIVWNQVQQRLTTKARQNHDLTFAGGLIRCGHCGNLVTGESVPKRLKSGEVKRYHYYRCTVNNIGDHPRCRVTETDLDSQFVDLFERLKIDQEARSWIAKVMKAKAGAISDERRSLLDELQRMQKVILRRKDRLLDLLMEDAIGREAYDQKQATLNAEEGVIRTQIAALADEQTVNLDLAARTFELSQSLSSRWLQADGRAKRNILEILLLNCTLNGVTLEFTMRKPFDVLAEGLLMKDGGGGGNRTRVP